MPSIWEGTVPTPYFPAHPIDTPVSTDSHMPMDPSQSSSATKPKKRPITRYRESLACVQCRTRKLKCDRGQPCGTCVRRDEADSCTYGRASDRDDAPNRARMSQGEARLQHLERLVEDFIQGKSRPSPESTGSVPAARDGYTSMDSQMTGDGRFLGSTHYSAMLDDIQELKDILYIAGDDYDETGPFDARDIDEFGVLFGGTPCPTLPVVLSRYLPSRAEVDRRVAAYFQSTAINAPFIHLARFTRQYQAFWDNQAHTSPLWISMLFSICQTSRDALPDLPSAPDDPHARDFSLAAAYTLALGRYHRPQRFSIDALLLYIQSNLVTRMDLPRDLGTLLATLIRLAYGMGYHRDPAHFAAHLTAFDAEMRRRAWAVCLQLDLLVSFQLGLPASVHPDSWDTAPLRNLLDSDLDERAPVLPPARAPTEPTQAMFYNAKQQLMTGFPKVLAHALAASASSSSSSSPSSPSPPSSRAAIEADLLAVDADLRRSYREIPDALVWGRNDAHAASMPTHALVTSRCLDLLYQKCLCVLHRAHVVAGREASVRVCLAAASAIVRSQLEVYPDVQPGGPLAGDRWLAFGALTWNDFLLGLMVLCLILRQHRRRPVAGLSGAEVEGVLGLLRASREICVEKAGESRECHRIIRLLDAVLADAMPVPASVGPSAVSAVGMAGGGGMEMGVGLGMGMEMEGGGLVGDFEGQVWSPLEANVFDGAEWAFLEESFDGGFG